MMDSKSVRTATVCIIGLGYVGFPLADAFSRHINTIGFDIDTEKIQLIKKTSPNFFVTNIPEEIKQADYIMICVPTPVTISKQADLTCICAAAELVGKNLKMGATVVLESTVYPGVTEEIVKPILEKESGLKCGKGFRIGYSPERINPGDTENVLSTITKIVAGMDDDTLTDLVELYGLITNVYKSKNIQTAEAAKVIENIQRDLNIALMNELALIFHHLNLDTKDVLDAAGSKWNFLRFSPGLVGGHCIPVDPYYLVARAQQFDYHPQVILAGRAINDSMPKYVAMMAIEGINSVGKVIKGSNVLIMGLTYKENIPDIRESPSVEIIHELKRFGVCVYGFDPHLSDDIIDKFGILNFKNCLCKVDAIIITVAHDQFRKMRIDQFKEYMNEHPVLIDVRRMITREDAEKNGIYYKGL
jgi:UDPglucose 6-dehydrogenase/UDP-N-acetyl-D-galactosamine dehydrogenase